MIRSKVRNNHVHVHSETSSSVTQKSRKGLGPSVGNYFPTLMIIKIYKTIQKYTTLCGGNFADCFLKPKNSECQCTAALGLDTRQQQSRTAEGPASSQVTSRGELYTRTYQLGIEWSEEPPP